MLSMSIQKAKINKLVSKFKPGFVATSKWLEQTGYSRVLMNHYKRYKWVTQIGNGAFCRDGDKPTWIGAIEAIQKQLEKKIYVGGITALSLSGYGHFLRKKERVFLFSTEDQLPKWFKSFDWQNEIILIKKKVFKNILELGITIKEIDNFQIKISCLERAIIETLFLVPTQVTLQEANLLMEGLINLDSKILQDLLQNCRSIRAKRLFLFLAERYEFDWLKKLNIKAIDLGKGKRKITKGFLNKKYQITVPKEFM